jgi:thiol-activated cytolysin
VRQSSIITTFCILLALLSCRKEETAITYKDIIASGGSFGAVNYNTQSTEIGETEEQQGDEIWTCTTTRVSVEDALGGENGFSLFNPAANIVYPGNLLQGKSLRNASPDNIPAKRGGGDITISLLDGSPVSSVYVEEISLGSVTTAANTILADKDDESVIPANFQFSRTIVQSEQEFALQVGADYENAWASISGNLSFSENNTYSRMMIRLEQSFYQLSFTEPPAVEDFFSPESDPADLERFIGPGNPACYISSVNYGRIFYMLVESSGTESELQAAVEAAFETPVSEGGGSISTQHFESFEEVNIKVFAFGGRASTTLQTAFLSKNELGQLGDLLAKATDVRTALPISYTVRSLETNEVVAVQLATEYDLRECYVTSALPPPVRTEHWSEVLDKLGSPVGALVRWSRSPSQQTLMLFDTSGTRYVLDDGEKIYDEVGYISSLLSGVDGFEDVGAGGIYKSGDFDRRMLINKRGNKAIYYTGQVTNFQWVGPLGIDMVPQLDYFSTEGVGGFCEGVNILIVVDKTGQYLTFEPYSGNATSELRFPTSLLTGGVENNRFPEGIAGVTTIAPQLYATVSKDGKRYMVYDANTEIYYGPYKL